MFRSSSISSDKIWKENVCKIQSSHQAENGIREKKFLDVTLVGEDDLDFVLHGMTLLGGWNTVVLLGLVKIQHQCSTMTWIQIRQIFINFLLLVLCVVLSMHSRAQWKISFFNFNFWHTFSFVFFNSKTGLFSCIFWSEDSFLCKFSCLCLHSGFTWRSRAKYIEWP